MGLREIAEKSGIGSIGGVIIGIVGVVLAGGTLTVNSVLYGFAVGLAVGLILGILYDQ